MNKLIFSLLTLSSLAAAQPTLDTEYIKLTKSLQDQEIFVGIGDEFRIIQNYRDKAPRWELIGYEPLEFINTKTDAIPALKIDQQDTNETKNQQVWTFKAKEVGHFKLIFKLVCPSWPKSAPSYIWKTINVEVRYRYCCLPLPITSK